MQKRGRQLLTLGTVEPTSVLEHVVLYMDGHHPKTRYAFCMMAALQHCASLKDILVLQRAIAPL